MSYGWINHIGQSAFAEAYQVAVTADGSIYLAGRTSGSLDGQTIGGFYDGFVQKRSSTGGLVWTSLSTEGSSAFTYFSVAADSSMVYAGGHGLIDARDVSGNLIWSTSLGRDFQPYTIAPSSAGIVLGGWGETGSGADTRGQSVICILDSTGILQSRINFGQVGVHNWVEGVAIQSNGNIVVCGRTNLPTLSSPFPITNINQPQGGDCFVATFDQTGSLIWRREFGGSAQDWAHSLGKR